MSATKHNTNNDTFSESPSRNNNNDTNTSDKAKTVHILNIDGLNLHPKPPSPAKSTNVSPVPKVGNARDNGKNYLSLLGHDIYSIIFQFIRINTIITKFNTICKYTYNLTKQANCYSNNCYFDCNLVDKNPKRVINNPYIKDNIICNKLSTVNCYIPQPSFSVFDNFISHCTNVITFYFHLCEFNEELAIIPKQMNKLLIYTSNCKKIKHLTIDIPVRSKQIPIMDDKNWSNICESYNLNQNLRTYELTGFKFDYNTSNKLFNSLKYLTRLQLNISYSDKKWPISDFIDAIATNLSELKILALTIPNSELINFQPITEKMPKLQHLYLSRLCTQQNLIEFITMLGQQFVATANSGNYYRDNDEKLGINTDVFCLRVKTLAVPELLGRADICAIFAELPNLTAVQIYKSPYPTHIQKVMNSFPLAPLSKWRTDEWPFPYASLIDRSKLRLAAENINADQTTHI